MTPQQERIFTLQASRNWGQFNEAETEHLNRILGRQKRQLWEEKVSPLKYLDQNVGHHLHRGKRLFSEPVLAIQDRFRVLQPGETLDNIKTTVMPGEER
jgi:hypothetical protein